MEHLFESYFRKRQLIQMDFIREDMHHIRWDARLVGIRGARGVGKTTLMLQYLHTNLPMDSSSLYVSLDHLWFANHSLTELADDFVKRGGKILFLDEVHKYPDWSVAIKNIFDDHSHLKMVFTGSSLLEILNARADLSRRAVVYHMHGLSFREYLNLVTGTSFTPIPLPDLLSHHLEIAAEITSQLRPLQYFDDYLTNGYYPYFREIPDLYHQRLTEVVNLILEIELPLLRGLDPAYVFKMKQLMVIIAESAPFIPNISKLGERIGVNRNTLIAYLQYLADAGLTRNIYRDARGISRLQKPDKIMLDNTNLQRALSADAADRGSLRETFFMSQLAPRHLVEYADRGDFLVDGKWTFEIGGKRKNVQQIRGVKDAFIAADNLETGIGNTIPLWLMGFCR